MEYRKLLEDYLNQEGGKYLVQSYSELSNEVRVRYRHPDRDNCAEVDVTLFDLLVFVYSKLQNNE
jgi:hypothetical protein